MITIDNLTLQYKRGATLFDQLSLSLEAGQIHGLLGLNGAGKSSLLHILQGLRYANQGKLSVFGHDPKQRKASFLQDSLLIPEEIYTPEISLKQFVDRFSPFYPSFSLESFLKFLNEFEIDRTVHLGRLSMGQRKKAFIAFGLATNTKVLMMDEPTNGLDIPSKKQFRKILNHIITDDRIFIISTHQIRDLHSLIDNVVILKEGDVIFNQTIHSIIQKLHFSLTSQPEQVDNLLYHERVPGGYMNIMPANEEDSFEPDLEVFFNAIITTPDLFQNIFQ